MSIPAHQAPIKRHVGVMTTNSERTGEPRYTNRRNAVLAITPVQMYVVQATDDTGKMEEPYTVLVSSGRVFLPPNYKEWTQQLKPVPETHWVHKQMMALIQESEQPVAPVKEVDVMGEDQDK